MQIFTTKTTKQLYHLEIFLGKILWADFVCNNLVERGRIIRRPCIIIVYICVKKVNTKK